MIPTTNRDTSALLGIHLLFGCKKLPLIWCFSLVTFMSVGWSDTRIPDLRALPIAVAKQHARIARLEFVHGEFVISSSGWRNSGRPQNVVMQTPQPRQIVKPGTVLAVWEGKQAGPNQSVVTTPDLSGLDLEAASASLRKIGLGIMASDSKGKEGDQRQIALQVTAQYPVAGQKVYEGTTVFAVFISKEGH